MDKEKPVSNKILLKIGLENVELDLNKMAGMGDLLRALEIDFDELINFKK